MVDDLIAFQIVELVLNQKLRIRFPQAYDHFSVLHERVLKTLHRLKIISTHDATIRIGKILAILLCL